MSSRLSITHKLVETADNEIKEFVLAVGIAAT